ncbi:MAG: hypothetical protein FJ363_12915 [Gemmatimonadetes bacterium]|nr:hypothetical protein [Gemmatimonadota bacterium]
MRTQSCPDFARLTLAALAVAASLGACKKEDAVAAPPAIGALAVVQGNNQSVQAGKELPLPVILRVVSTNGDAMARHSGCHRRGRRGGCGRATFGHQRQQGGVHDQVDVGPSLRG